MKKSITLILILLLTAVSFAQDSKFIYATMDAADAVYFKTLHPDEMTILASNDYQAAVFISEEVTHSIHDNVTTHGPGYIFRSSKEKALEALERVEPKKLLIDYTITEDAFVNECLDLVDGQKIEDVIRVLEDYGTRYHTRPQAEQAVLDLQTRWDNMISAAGRTDIHTRIFTHVNTPMPSVILTIDGANTPDEFVIIGGHIDSTASPSDDDAPGADDDASGIATLTEMVRVLLAKNFVPNRTIEVMAFAAEEVGLVGSDEIAAKYAVDGVDVAAYVQFDMTAYKGSAEDIYITTDPYNSTELNDFLMELMDHYNGSGAHAFTYGTTICNYGCSDHASWANYGYNAAFPFEAAFGEHNPNIHRAGDTFAFLNNTDHAVKFAKLGLEFLIEAAKPQILSVEDFSELAMNIYVKNKTLNYQLKNTASNVKQLEIFNVAGQKVFSDALNNASGEVKLEHFSQGFYISKFVLENGHSLTQKFILN
ncbi:M20/M25/M40 family metallo-hydrolase [Aequorivita sp. Q41]|uniref:M20/M25/M40 family metallo-hydrolase n=1 Tax=Aequorivita sp. Q41 TaxID=3153300 RepID=UPI0032420C5B